MTSAGDLRWRVRFDRKVENVEGDYGGIPGGWDEQFTRWAYIKPLMGGEGVQEQRLNGTQPSLIIVRYDELTKAITPAWRAVEMLNGQPVRYFALKTAVDMERERAFITMMAVEGEADGGDGPI